MSTTAEHLLVSGAQAESAKRHYERAMEVPGIAIIGGVGSNADIMEATASGLYTVIAGQLGREPELHVITLHEAFNNPARLRRLHECWLWPISAGNIAVREAFANTAGECEQPTVVTGLVPPNGNRLGKLAFMSLFVLLETPGASKAFNLETARNIWPHIKGSYRSGGTDMYRHAADANNAGIPYDQYWVADDRFFRPSVKQLMEANARGANNYRAEGIHNKPLTESETVGQEYFDMSEQARQGRAAVQLG